ncbi:MAG TPA: methylenetetrahydrofolate reductase [Alphaproteobacteria bacterium]|nr:methylenetetrahydrofolate reductase [Alphaproteobacteria bacterium]
MAATVSVSFEFFPPAEPQAEGQFWNGVDRLAPLGPNFVSLTYGAGGSTRERGGRILRALLRRGDLEVAAHLTCVGASRAELEELAREWAAAGLKRIVALRGDGEGQAAFVPHPNGFTNTAEFVAALRRIAPFDISVAAYPECHPQAASPAADLDSLRRKLDAGAERAITQFFFEPECFLRFRDRAAAAGIDKPIIPGILPIFDFAKVVAFSRRCRASVPAWLAARFAGLDGDAETSQLLAAATAGELCQNLRAEGVEAFHFYTLNRAALTHAVCRSLGLSPNMAAAEEAA